MSIHREQIPPLPDPFKYKRFSYRVLRQTGGVKSNEVFGYNSQMVLSQQAGLYNLLQFAEEQQVPNGNVQLSDYHNFSAFNRDPMQTPNQISKFPSDFNPREAKSMDNKEKVMNWMMKVPIYLLNDSTWCNNCYSGNTSTSASSDDSFDEGTLEFPDYSDMLELQARKVTKYIKKLYSQEAEKTARVGELHGTLYSDNSVDDFLFENGYGIQLNQTKNPWY